MAAQVPLITLRRLLSSGDDQLKDSALPSNYPWVEPDEEDGDERAERPV